MEEQTDLKRAGSIPAIWIMASSIFRFDTLMVYFPMSNFWMI